MPTSAALPATIAPQSRARTDTHDVTSPTHRNTTSASWRVSSKTAHTNKPCTTHGTLTHSIQTHKPRTPARRPAQPQPPRSAQASLHSACTPHTARHTAPRTHPTHCPQKIARSHTRGLRATLTIVQPGYPTSTGCCRRVGSDSSPRPCRTHASRRSAHLSTSHRKIKSSQMTSQSAHCMLSLTHNTVRE
jgi:hypothetical protein